MTVSTSWLDRFGKIACGALVFAAASLLSACQGDSTSSANYSGQSATTSGTSSSVSSSVATGGATAPANRAPTISGVPNTEVLVGARFQFAPTSTDADGNSLLYSVANLPAWADFNTATGTISGTPDAADVGTYYDITISVTDGKATTSLSSFSVVVTQAASGKVTLSWVPPTENTDGSTLLNLAGYKIHYGNNAEDLDQVVTIASSGVTAHVIQNLTSGYWYFSLRAYSTGGAESDLSAVIGTRI